MRWLYGLAIAVIGIAVVADAWFDLNYQLAANIALLVLGALVATFAAVLYALRSRWWANRIGKVYLAKTLVLALVLMQIAVASWWDTDYPAILLIS